MGLVKVVMASFDELLGEVGEELKGIADYWKVDLGLVVGLNFAYEFRRVSVYCAMLLDIIIYFLGMSSQDLFNTVNTNDIFIQLCDLNVYTCRS